MMEKKLTKNIFKTTIILSSFVVFSKLLGLIKQIIIASYFGANIETDAYFIATGILISLGMVLFSAIYIAALPIYTNLLKSKGIESSNRFINSLLAMFIPLSLTLTFIFFVFSDSFAKLFTNSSDIEFLEILSKYIKIMSITFVMSCYQYVLNVILESRGIFLPAKLYGFFQNTFIIVAVLFFSNKYGMNSLVIAFLLALFIQCVVVTIKVSKYYKLSLNNIQFSPELKTFGYLIIPLLIGNGIYQLNDIVDKKIASGLGEGSASILTYGQSINEIISVVVVGTISTILFSNFSNLVAEKSNSRLKDLLTRTINILIILLVITTFITIVYSREIIEIIYTRGSFNKLTSYETSLVLVSYSFGFVFMAIRGIVIRVFYAYQNSKIPMVNGLVAVSINIILTIYLSTNYGIIGIGIATSVSMTLAAMLSLFELRKFPIDFKILPITILFIKSVISLGFAFVVYLLIDSIFSQFFFLRIVLGSLLTTLTYLIMLYVFKTTELINLTNKYIKRI